ncbi:MAG: YbfB/YjiJ family MFS transporter [Rhodanobacter sp.]
MLSPLRSALAGMAVLALALGIGRFAFTPLLPLMQASSGLSLVDGGWLASINNVGYMLGALACIGLPLPQRLALRGGTFLLALATLGMGLAASLPWWMLCRFAAGVGAALLMVHGIAWCTAHLRAQRRAGLESLLFSGPGIGVVATGALVAAMHGPAMDSARWWLVFGALSALVAVPLWPMFAVPDRAAPAAAAAGPRQRGTVWPLVSIYGLLGFSYIIPAIFLPLIADAQLHVPALREWFWPLYGVAAVLTTWLLGALPAPRSNYAGLAACLLAQLLGILLCLYRPRLDGLLLGTALLGAMSMPSVMFTMREANRLAGHNPTRLIGALTVAFSIGQIAGPVVAATLATHRHGFGAALELAALATAVALLTALAFARRGRSSGPAVTRPGSLAMNGNRDGGG